MDQVHDSLNKMVKSFLHDLKNCLDKQMNKLEEQIDKLDTKIKQSLKPTSVITLEIINAYTPKSILWTCSSKTSEQTP